MVLVQFFRAQLAKIVHKVNFNSNDNQVVSADNTIGFTTFHKFRDYERVVYKTNDEDAIVGLSTNTLTMLELKIYTVKLYNNQDDVSVESTLLVLVTLWELVFIFSSMEKKAVLSKVVVNGGSNYTNNEREIPEFDAVKGVGISSASESCGDPQSSI